MSGVRLIFDERQRYRGHTQSLSSYFWGCLVLGPMLVCIALFPFLWPLVFVPEPFTWPAQVLWLLFLLGAFLFIGSRQQPRRPAADPPDFRETTLPMAALCGPRDWTPPPR
jgi:hypothetical protein